MIIKLSNLPLSRADVSLLSKGLSFCPTLCHLNKKEVVDDLERYFRRLHLGEFFVDIWEEEEENDTSTEFHSPSSWIPPKGRYASLEAYTLGIRTNVETQLKRLQAFPSKDNLSSKERMALKNLRKCKDIIIKPADKASAVVVHSRESCIKEADRQLINELHYQNLPADPTTHHMTEIQAFVRLMFHKGLID